MIIKQLYWEIKRIYYVLSIYFVRGGKFNLLWGLRFLNPFSSKHKINIQSKAIGKVKVFLYGLNHELIIEEGVVFKRGKIWFEDNNCRIHIMENSTIEESELAALEDNRCIIIGKDCMFSSGIRIATSDSHSVLDENGERKNPASDIIIGNHVWIGANCSINKGVSIGDNSIIAGHSVLTKSVPGEVIAAGVPAKIVKIGYSWNRKRL